MAVTAVMASDQGKTTQREAQRQGAMRRRRAATAAPGSRLAAAFEAVERFPVLIESRERVMRAATAETARVGELVEAVESDVALTISVLRFANRSGVVAGGVGSIPEAIDVLKPSGVLAIAGTAPVFDFFESNGGWELQPERFRVHALATQRAADQIGRAVGWAERDELAVAALLHDIGRLVISSLHPGYKRLLRRRSRAPPSSACAKNATSSASTTRWSAACWRGAGTCRSGSRSRSSATTPRTPTAWRRWSPPPTWSPTTPRARRSRPERLRASAERCGLGPDGPARAALRASATRARTAPRISEPCPLSARELDVLRHLSEGMVYKQIAGEMQLSVSTIRTHLHNVYGKIGAVDRAQAVLTARDRGWI